MIIVIIINYHIKLSHSEDYILLVNLLFTIFFFYSTSPTIHLLWYVWSINDNPLTDTFFASQVLTFSSRSLRSFSELLLIELQCAILLKQRLWQLFSCKSCKFFKNTFLTEHLRAPDSVKILIFLRFHNLLKPYLKSWYLPI